MFTGWNVPTFQVSLSLHPMPPPFQVFLVEDHPVMREAYASVLAEEGDIHLCGSVETAEEALMKLIGMACDLVVTDLRLPGMSGVDLVEQLHAARPDLPALVISAHPEDVYAQRARDAGAVGFLSKKGLAGTLVPTIRQVLEGRLPASA